MSRERSPLCYIPNCGELNSEQKRCDEATQLERRFGINFEKIVIRRIAAGRHLEFFACHVTEALCVIYQNCGELNSEQKRCDEATQLERRFGSHFEKIVIRRVVAGRHLEFFACHVTEALCVIYQIVGNLILNKKVIVN